MLKIGKLYICEEFFLLLYPDPETAAHAADHADADAARRRIKHSADARATYWSNRFGKPVLYAKKNIPILVLNSKEKFYEVLAGDRKGWIIYQDWLELKEISNENIS